MVITQKLRNLSQHVYRIAGSRHFFIAVVVLAIIQGIWFALSFKPVLFDELRHLQFIEFYSHHINPFVTSQTSSMDALGQVTREPSFLYYYAMSAFLRVVQVFTGDFAVQVILLRLINIALFVLSLFLFKKLFRELKASSAVINITLLAFILIPAVGPIIGAVTYDIGVLPLIVLMMLYTVRIMKKPGFDVRLVSLFVVVSCLASVVKYTSLPIAAICVSAILIHYARTYKKHSSKLWNDSKRQFGALSGTKKALLIVALVLSLGLFVERPVQNLVLYKNLAPSCFDTLSGDNVEERCSQNYVYQRDIQFLSAKSHSFVPVDQVNYFVTTWLPGMHSSMIQQYPNMPPMLIMVWLYYAAIFGGAIVTLLGIRQFLGRNPLRWMLFVAAIFYVLSVYYSNYKGYTHLGQPVAITARYLIPVLPIFIYLVITTMQGLAGRMGRQYLPLVAVAYVVLCTQGGGITTHLMSANQDDYWQNGAVKSMNTAVKTLLLKVTKN